MCRFIDPYFVANLTLCPSTDDNFKVQMKRFFLLLNLKEQQISGRSPFTIS